MRELRLRVPWSSLGALGVEELLDLLGEREFVRFRSLSSRGSTTTVLLEVREPLEAGRFAALEYVRSIDLVGQAPDHLEYLLRVDLPGCRETLDEAAGEFFVEGPVRLEDGRLTLTAVATQDAVERFDAMFETADEDAADFEVLHVGEYRARNTRLGTLTERQREILTAAYERDYFEVPRGVTGDELAAEFDLDKSTVLEHIRRAERNLLDSLLKRDGAEPQP